MKIEQHSVTLLVALLWVVGALLFVCGLGMLAFGNDGWIALIAGTCVLLTAWFGPSTLRSRILEILARIGP